MRSKAKAIYLKAWLVILALASVVAAGGGKLKWY
jgi:hypothetical protein